VEGRRRPWHVAHLWTRRASSSSNRGRLAQGPSLNSSSPDNTSRRTASVLPLLPIDGPKSPRGDCCPFLRRTRGAQSPLRVHRLRPQAQTSPCAARRLRRRTVTGSSERARSERKPPPGWNGQRDSVLHPPSWQANRNRALAKDGLISSPCATRGTSVPREGRLGKKAEDESGPRRPAVPRVSPTRTSLRLPPAPLPQNCSRIERRGRS